MSEFLPTNKTLFFSKKDPTDLRLGDIVQKEVTQTQEKTFLIGGFPDDEGIFHNGGRTGACKGPNAIRERLYRMTPPPFSPSEFNKFQLVDKGNLNVDAYTLEQRHQIASKKVLEALNHSHSNHWISLGGGHDYGFPDGDAFLEHSLTASPKPVVINFDAHLDVRPLKDGTTITSGTPFYRLLEKYGNSFDFLEVGLQPYCNSRHHFQWLKDKGGKSITMDQIRTELAPLSKQILQALGMPSSEGQRRRPCFLSVDIDAFSSAFAPGCSQSWPAGMTPAEFFPCLKVLCNIFSVKVLGVYEVSPPLDHDSQTAKLAAEIIYHFIFNQSE